MLGAVSPLIAGWPSEPPLQPASASGQDRQEGAFDACPPRNFLDSVACKSHRPNLEGDGSVYGRTVAPASGAGRWTVTFQVELLAARSLTPVAAARFCADPRVGLAAGLDESGVASLGVELPRIATSRRGSSIRQSRQLRLCELRPRVRRATTPSSATSTASRSTTSRIRPNPTLVTAVVCPGGQGEVSVYGNLLFMSVEESRAASSAGDPTVGTRFQGVRVFDISNLANPVQVAAVQTCRGSHTHTLLKSPHDDANLYVYVNGTSSPRPASTMAGCNNNPANRREPVALADRGDQGPARRAALPGGRGRGAPLPGDRRPVLIHGLQNTLPSPQHPSGMNWSPQPITDACHDITVYPAIDLAAGACEGNGLLIDISDPANPVRIDEVSDPLFAYWHGATFSNDGTKVVFTDEWGGGTAARCRATDQLNWGANAIYDIVDGEMEFRSYFKMPATQTLQENCVSHLPSLIPVPGRTS